MPRVKLTDKQRKKVIADYIETGNYAETGRLNNISANAVKKIVLKDKDSSEKFAQKKEENTKDILEYMDTIADKQKEIIDLSMDALVKKLKKPDAFTTVKDIATVYGVIFDKAMKSKEIKLKQSGNENSNKKVVIVNDLPR